MMLQSPSSRWYGKLIMFSVAGTLAVIAVLIQLRAWHNRSRPSLNPSGPIPQKLVERLQKYVFPVRAFGRTDGKAGKQQIDYGTCIAMGTGGHFLTVKHVVEQAIRKNGEMEVLLKDSQPVRVAAANRARSAVDLVFLKAESAVGIEVGGLERPPFRVTPLARQERVFIAGFPIKYAGTVFPKLIVTSGTVDAPAVPSPLPEIHAKPVIKVSGATDVGASGGALVDEDGKLVGLVFAARVANDRQTTHIYAIRIADLLQFIDQSTEDSDGDGILDINESKTDRWVADYPLLVFDFGPPECGLARQQDTQELHLAIRSADLVSTSGSFQKCLLDRSIYYEESATRYRGSIAGFLRGFDRVFPFDLKYGGYHSQARQGLSIRRSTTFLTRKSAVQKIHESLRVVTTKKVAVGPKAGYLRIPLQVSASHPCVLERFSVTVRVNGKDLWTFPSAAEPLTLRGKYKPGGILVMRFDELPTDEMIERVLSNKDISIQVHVPESTIRLRRNNEDFAERIKQIERRCALVRLLMGDQRLAYYISAKDSSLDTLLKRVPIAKGIVEWKQGPQNDYYLSRFGNDRGDAELFPEFPANGKWFVSVNRQIVTTDPKKLNLEPGDEVELAYTTSEEYFGSAKEWRHYVHWHRKLLDLQEKEFEFWRSLRSYWIAGKEKNHANEKAWDAAARNIVQRDAKKLADLYVQVFLPNDHQSKLPRMLQATYPFAEKQIQRFREMFLKGDIQLPTFTATLKKAELNWNIDRKLDDVEVVVKCGGKAFKATNVQLDDPETGQSGFVRFGQNASFKWHPYKQIEIEAKVGGAPFLWLFPGKKMTGASLLLRDYHALVMLLRDHPFKAFDADPNLSRIRIVAEIKSEDGEWVPSGQLFEVMRDVEPRVVPLVPWYLYPEVLALSFWLQRSAPAYSRAAWIYEDLVKNGGQEKEEEWAARAIVAHFRALNFSRCKNLARLAKNRDSRKNVFSGMTWDKVKMRVSLAAYLCSTEEGVREHKALLARFLRDSNSSLLLRDVVRDPAKLRLWNTHEIESWKNTLIKKMGQWRKRARSIKQHLLRDYLEDRIEYSVRILKHIELSK